MKIERMDTKGFIRSLGMKNSFNASQFRLEEHDKGVMINELHLVPFNNILEIVFAAEPKVETEVKEVKKSKKVV